MLFDKRFPNISEWVSSRGWIEFGLLQDPGFIQALDDGGVVWDSEDHYETIDQALQALEHALEDFI